MVGANLVSHPNMKASEVMVLADAGGSLMLAD